MRLPIASGLPSRVTVPVTTAKDYARLNLDSRAMVEVAGAALEWRNPAQIETLLARLLDA